MDGYRTKDSSELQRENNARWEQDMREKEATNIAANQYVRRVYRLREVASYPCKYGHHDCSDVLGGKCLDEMYSELSPRARGLANELLGD